MKKYLSLHRIHSHMSLSGLLLSKFNEACLEIDVHDGNNKFVKKEIEQVFQYQFLSTLNSKYPFKRFYLKEQLWMELRTNNKGDNNV